jgi:hypothetical protein
MSDWGDEVNAAVAEGRLPDFAPKQTQGFNNHAVIPEKIGNERQAKTSPGALIGPLLSESSSLSIDGSPSASCTADAAPEESLYLELVVSHSNTITLESEEVEALTHELAIAEFSTLSEGSSSMSSERSRGSTASINEQQNSKG